MKEAGKHFCPLLYFKLFWKGNRIAKMSMSHLNLGAGSSLHLSGERPETEELLSREILWGSGHNQNYLEPKGTMLSIPVIPQRSAAFSSILYSGCPFFAGR